ASVNIIDTHTYNSLKRPPVLEPVQTKIFPYGSQTPLPIVGKFDCEVRYKDKQLSTTFFVLEGSGGCLLSYHMALGLELIHIVHTVDNQTDSEVQTLIDKNSYLFSGLGKRTNPFSFKETKRGRTPVPRRVRHH
ncbi:hypothetical protein XELAEV_18031375mg, partial [Xenopus laevis]